MSKLFTILHLSDAHFGNPKHKPEAAQVLTPLLRDLHVVQEELQLKPNLVLFSGDVAFGETDSQELSSQYKAAADWLGQLYQVLDTRAEDAPLLTVPGNHDINKHQVGVDQTDWLRKATAEQVYETMEASNVTWRRFLDRQNEWRDFAKTHFVAPNLVFNDCLNASCAIIPWGHEVIGVTCLNSSWGSFVGGKEEKGRMWVGKYQLDWAISRLAECTLKVAVSHHPSSWLDDGEATKIDETIQSRFQIHLHGHEHSQWFSDPRGHLKVAAGPCYVGADKENAYSWLVIDFEGQNARLFLRSYQAKGAGGWVPLIIPGKTDNNGRAETKSLFADREDALPRTTSRVHVDKGCQKPSLTPVNPAFASLTNFNDYIQVLQDRFAFRCEPSAMGGAADDVTAYWPVRLRPPTPIHAVQCFAAAGLQTLGAKIVLCLDDLGNAEAASPDAFLRRAEKWFAKANGKFEDVESVLFSRLITPERSRDIWGRVETWLGRTNYKLKQVLTVSKLSENVGSLQQLFERRPRKLLTPPMVWACLDHYLSLGPRGGFITLGGHDERELWAAWRELTAMPQCHVGHLYAPELKESSPGDTERTLYMGKTGLNLAWDSKEDVRQAVEHDFSTGGDAISPSRLLGWCITGCVMLPAFLAGNEAAPTAITLDFNHLETLRGVASAKVASEASALVAQWLL